MTKKEQIWQKLKTVLDPELGINIVDLGLAYRVRVEGDKIEILMTLTTPFCPLSAFFEHELTEKVKRIKWVKDAKIDFTFDPPWDASKMTDEARLQLGL